MPERGKIGARVAGRIRRDFPEPEVASRVCALLEEWGDAWPLEARRVQAAIVLKAAGDVDTLVALVDLAHVDYRDALMATGFADEDWRERMEAAFRSG
ncbi:hypothetical protein RM572_27175 [Streptomyces sp. DSM 42041]|uniref:Uncharacterized protein n=1 Tax=Streptomyces hazeniae TaxID=3075538 RepID=A0ABU2NZN2_9ACTN|nr:hypothetical protein [Streptomyces sp. DSM 42041]MDT0382445.1 hypothetical protein [Streptomyces sp. DSM 42041]